MNKPDTKTYSNAFKALGDETRLKIVLMLNNQARPVNEIVDFFNLSQPTISRHLAVLKQAGLVKAKRHSQQILYSLNEENISDKVLQFFTHLDCCQSEINDGSKRKKK